MRRIRSRLACPTRIAARACVPILGAALAATPAPAREPASVLADSRIERVTVYPDRAAVTRVARAVSVGPAGIRLRFENLPAGTFTESVRASGQGEGSVRIANVDVARTFLIETTTARAESLRALASALDREKERLRARREAHEEGARFLKSLAAERGGNAAEALAGGAPTAAQLREVYALIDGALGENGTAVVALDSAVAWHDERLTTVQREIQALGAAGGDGSWTATVDLVADAPSRVDVWLEYVVSGASWAPRYDVRVSEDLSRIELVSFAEVRQTTGEAWEDVAVSLSTAQPALGAQVPDLEPTWLRLPEPPRYEFRHRAISDAAAEGIAGGAGTISVESSTSEHAIDVAYDFRPRKPEVPHIVATPAPSGVAARFDVPLPQSLQPDGAVRRMTIAAVPLDGRLTHESVPSRSAHAYLVASVRNASSIPLLPGKTLVFLGSQFLGSGWLDGAAPGQEVQLSLGVDPGVTVARDLVRKERRAAGRPGGEERVAYAYRTRVENHRGVPIEVRIRDQFPVSQDGDVKVSERRLAPEATERVRETGEVAWRLAIPAGESRSLELGYEVAFPSGRAPIGLF